MLLEKEVGKSGKAPTTAVIHGTPFVITKGYTSPEPCPLTTLSFSGHVNVG